MKITNDYKKEFTPISFTFTCESVEDVKLLWSLLNVPSIEIIKASEKINMSYASNEVCRLMDYLWADVNDLAVSLGIRTYD